MKLFLSLLALVTVLIASCATVNDKPWSDGKADTIMWRVADDDSELYLLGSIHMGDDSMYPLDSEIYAAFDETEAVVVELDPRNIDPQVAMGYMMAKDGKKLSEKISAENFEMLKSTLSSMIPVNQLEMFKPWAAAMTMMQIELMQKGMSKENGIDVHFMDKAAERNIPIEQLETLDFQFSLFDKLSADGDAFFSFMEDEVENQAGDVVVEMAREWSEGDVEGLNNILNEQMDKTKDEALAAKLREELFTKRNLNMTSKVKDYLRDNKKYFVIAGAGHMIGEGGIVDLLRKSGNYTITRY
jgi:uncharacterized protein YbaP (TraB family)